MSIEPKAPDNAHQTPQNAHGQSHPRAGSGPTKMHAGGSRRLGAAASSPADLHLVLVAVQESARDALAEEDAVDAAVEEVLHSIRLAIEIARPMSRRFGASQSKIWRQSRAP